MTWQFWIIACWTAFSITFHFYAAGKRLQVTASVGGAVWNAMIGLFVLWSLASTGG